MDPLTLTILVLYPILNFLSILSGEDSESNGWFHLICNLGILALVGCLFAIATGWAAIIVFGYIFGCVVLGLLGLVIRRAL